MSDPTAPGPLAATAALMADPARARMLAAMMGGEALTAGELARIAGVVPATASGHLSRLVEGGLVAVHAQGRHRYHRLASEEVAAVLETLGGLSARLAPRPWKHGDAAREARLCWNHLAGRLGVALHERLTNGTGWLTPVPGGWTASDEGRTRLAATGVDLDRAMAAPRFACDCMDWSERRAHLAGGLGREIATAWLDRGWLRRLPGDGDRDVLARRRVALTPAGRRGLREGLGLDAA
ncbi:winged helix-turn-helix transcriptional regulator [Roseomonas terrae]|uniref:Winged helix-turn-helix transcriptional regulator n=1 Tax=Neoroseomonas terrae TaxID=424799 RepID=A0ABS5EQK9_9PROT|nr:winged helix-turn-helix domain-containing protein [Neoroseomonas terrae]MBR0653316.1 winged helix-turn-helix transcriptional regulator [Neoroseomonas terrae]